MSITLRAIYRAPEDFAAEHRIGEPWEQFAAAAAAHVAATREPIVAATDWEPVYPITRATMWRINRSKCVEEVSVRVTMTFSDWSGADTERVVDALRSKLNGA